MAGLDTILGLQRALGKPVLYGEMLRRFAAGQANILNDLQQALAAGDVVLAERLAHTLRSVAANIGAQAVSDRAQALEGALRSHQTADTHAALLVELGSALLPVLVGLQAWMPQAEAAAENPQAEAQGAGPADALERLGRLLARDDPAAADFLQHNASVLKAVLGDAFKVVEMHTLNFDFERALEAMAAVPGPEHPAVQPP